MGVWPVACSGFDRSCLKALPQGPASHKTHNNDNHNDNKSGNDKSDDRRKTTNHDIPNNTISYDKARRKARERLNTPFHWQCCPRTCLYVTTFFARLRSLSARKCGTRFLRRVSPRFCGTPLFARRNVPTVCVSPPAGPGARSHSRAREPTEGPPVVWHETA